MGLLMILILRDKADGYKMIRKRYQKEPGKYYKSDSWNVRVSFRVLPPVHLIGFLNVIHDADECVYDASPHSESD